MMMTLEPLTWPPKGNPEQGLATQDIQVAQALLLIKGEETGKPLVDYSSSDSVPELVDSDGEVCSGEAPPKVLEPVKITHKRPIDSKTSPFTVTAAVVKTSPPQFLNASPRKRSVMLYTSEAPLTTQEIPEDEIIYIDDDSEDPAPIKQLTHHADKVDHQRAQLMTQLTSAVVPLKKLQISETPQDTSFRILPTPQSEEFTPEAPKMQ